jgi:hypothetical protein
VVFKVEGSRGGFLWRLQADGGAPGASGSDAVIVAGQLQENGERESERLQTRGGKIRDQEGWPGTSCT